ncbi:MAG: hypothetical protein U0324_03610 [Polyangiales bacterium]
MSTRVVPWFLRLRERGLARRDVIESMAWRLHRERRVDPGDVVHAFGFKCDELGFARALLGGHARFHLYRTHQQRRCGDFAVVDMSATSPSRRVLRVVELKRDEPVRVNRGAGLQLTQADALRDALARGCGAVSPDAPIERVTGDARAVLAWLAS